MKEEKKKDSKIKENRKKERDKEQKIFNLTHTQTRKKIQSIS